MGQAVATGGILPVIVPEPAELCGRFCLKMTAGSLLETTDFKGDSGWIEKSVIVLAINGNGLTLPGNCSTADTADQRFCFFFLPFPVCLRTNRVLILFP